MSDVNPMDAINKILGDGGNGIPAPGTPAATLRWLVCRTCTGIVEHDMGKLPPTECPLCKNVTAFTVMPSKDKAVELAKNLVEQATRPAAPAVPATPPVQAPQAAPIPVAPAPFVPPAPPAPAPKTSRTRKAPVTVPAVSPTVAPAPAASEPVSPAMEDGAVSEHHADPKAAREAAVNALILKHGLNEVEVKEVTHGAIFTLGFTRWVENDQGNRVPVYSFKEMTDTPQSFKEELVAARAESGLIAIDVARVVVQVPEVVATTWGSELIASLKNNHGPVMVSPGARVRLGAKVGKTGRLIWFVLGVQK